MLLLVGVLLSEITGRVPKLTLLPGGGGWGGDDVIFGILQYIVKKIKRLENPISIVSSNSRRRMEMSVVCIEIFWKLNFYSVEEVQSFQCRMKSNAHSWESTRYGSCPNKQITGNQPKVLASFIHTACHLFVWGEVEVDKMLIRRLSAYVFKWLSAGTLYHVTQTAVFVDHQGRSCADWLVQTRLGATLRPSRSQPLEDTTR